MAYVAMGVAPTNNPTATTKEMETSCGVVEVCDGVCMGVVCVEVCGVHVWVWRDGV